MEKVLQTNYEPGRTVADVVEGYEMRIMQLLQMIEVTQLLKKAKAEIIKSQNQSK